MKITSRNIAVAILSAPVREGGGQATKRSDLLGSQGETSPSSYFSAPEYGMYAMGSLHDGRGFYDAYSNMGGITVNALSAGLVLDAVGTAVGRTNGTGQSVIGEMAGLFKGTGLLEVNIGAGGVTSKIGSGGMALAENLYDFGKRTYDFASLKKYAETHDAAHANAAYEAYVYGASISVRSIFFLADFLAARSIAPVSFSVSLPFLYVLFVSALEMAVSATASM